MMKRRACGSVNMPVDSCHSRTGVDRQQSQDGAELNQNREALAEIVVAEAEEPLHQQEVPGRGHRNELGQPLDDRRG